MKFTFGFFIILFSIFEVVCQNYVIDTIFDSNGRIKGCGYIIDKKKNGTWHFFHENGISEHKMTYFNDELIFVRNYEKGRIFEICIIIQKRKSEESICFRVSGENTLNEYYKIIDKVIDGNYYEFYPSLSLKSIKQYKKGKNDGRCLFFYENSVIQSVGNSYLGNKIGLWNYFYENGIKESDGKFVIILISKNNAKDYDSYLPSMINGYISVKNGVWNYYASDGKKIREEFYKNGKLISLRLIDNEP